MRKLAVCISLLFLVPVFATAGRAQAASQTAEPAHSAETAKPPAHFYRLDFVLEEFDAAGKPDNSRSFTTTVSTAGSRYGSITVGTKVPIATGTEAPKTSPNNLLTQFQYIDTGVKITARYIEEEGDRLAFDLQTEISEPVTPIMLEGVSEPAFHLNVWSGEVLIPIGKPIAVFKSDLLDSKGSMQLLVTATRVD